MRDYSYADVLYYIIQPTTLKRLHGDEAISMPIGMHIVHTKSISCALRWGRPLLTLVLCMRERGLQYVHSGEDIATCMHLT